MGNPGGISGGGTPRTLPLPDPDGLLAPDDSISRRAVADCETEMLGRGRALHPDLLEPDWSRPRAPEVPLAPDSAGARSWARVSGGGTEPVTPLMGAVGTALANDYRVMLSRPDGSPVLLTRAQLIEYARNPERLQRDFGLDVSDLSSVLQASADEGVPRGSTLDLTRTAEPRLYDRNDGNLGTTLGAATLRSAGELLSITDAGMTGGDGAFRGVERPQTFWEKLLDVLIEIFTLGFANTRLFNETPWRDNAAAAAMAGGPALRHAVLEATTPEARQRLLDQLTAACQRSGLSPADARGAAEAMLGELNRLYQNPNVDDAFCAAAQRFLLRTGPGAFGTMTPGQYMDQLVGQIGNDPAAMQAATRMLDSSMLAAAGPRAQAAVLAQALHHPNATAIDTLARLSHTGWFLTMTPDDQERATRVLAYSASVLHNATDPTQRAIIRHTLDNLLPPNGRVELRFEPHTDAPGQVSEGWTSSAHPGVIFLNEGLIRDGTSAVDDIAVYRSRMLDTLAHEMNHELNGDRNASTHDYFMGEYGAWYVGFTAANGRPPTRAEAYDRCVYLLTQTEGAYASLRTARLATGPDGSPGPEARRMIAFMASLSGERVDPSSSDAATRAVRLRVSAGNTPAPVPDVPRVMDNAVPPRESLS